MVIGRMYRKRTKLPTQRVQYQPVYDIAGGLDYRLASTLTDARYTPNCHEVTFRDGVISGTKGVEYFAGTNTVPLTGTFMKADYYVKMDESEKLILHTVSNTYHYNTTSSLPECITYGEVVEDCEDVWAVNANVTCAVDTDYRKGTNSVKLTIAAAFTTGVAGYEDFTADNFTTYTYLHFYIKSSVSTAAADLQLILGDTTGGGTPVGGSDSGRFNIPALVAGVWQEVSIAITTPSNLATVESVALYVKVDKGAQIVNIDDVLITKERTGDEDNPICSTIINNYYLFNNGIQPIYFWDMSTATSSTLTGATTLACKAMAQLGERVCLYHVIAAGTAAPRRVQWTIVGGISTPPTATDWTNTGSGDTDLDSVFGEDVIQTALPLGNYVMIYGKDNIIMQEYTGLVSKPFAFYRRVSGVGTPAERGVCKVGDKHILLGYDDVYMYKGGTNVESIGDKVSKEIFTLLNPKYIGRSFIVYVREQEEVRVYFPLVGETTPSTYFSYNLKSKAWSRGSRSYTGFGSYYKVSADTWASIGGGAATWDNVVGRWGDVTQSELSPINIYGNTSGVLYQDNETTYNHAGVAIDSYWDTKDFVLKEGYRRTTAYWAALNFEARGHTLSLYYSVDFGYTWTSLEDFTLTGDWAMYNSDFEIYSPQVRFRFRNLTVNESFDLRMLENGVIAGSDRGVA